MIEIENIDMKQPVLLAGPTGSGKSALAMRIAKRQARPIINADALQVYRCWRVLTARPSPEDEARALHFLYGHVGFTQEYSVGAWLSEVHRLLDRPEQSAAPVIVGGTGLYFRALTEGLAEIPRIPAHIRAEADARRENEGLAAMIADLDAATASNIDLRNPMRVQRAWEVARATGRGLAAWQRETPPPLVPLAKAHALLLTVDVETLRERIASRFDAMIDNGALDEARAVEPTWDPKLPACKAIGAPELIAHLRGEMTLKAARDAAIVSTHQYAKRQRTWFRARMGSWQRVAAKA